MPSHEVFILGAGFTKAFLPDAPLMAADYDADGELTKRFGHIAYAKRLIDFEKQSATDGLINIERLMSRLDAGMPYDADRTARAELDFLLYEVKEAFFRRLALAVKKQPHKAGILKFAEYCIRREINCITFNYDDYFDWALAYAQIASGYKIGVGWHPDWGYGFPCKGVPRFSGSPYVMHHVFGTPPMTLLKLHGSVNWRVQIGYQAPFNPDAVLHHEGWQGFNNTEPEWVGPASQVEGIEREPFLVPPVLVKSAIVKEPVLRILWTKAFRLLETAKRVVFLGYSLPVTDLAARFLFREAISNTVQVEVIVKPSERNPDADKARLSDNYETLFWKPKALLTFEDARTWIEREVSKAF